MIVRHPGAPSSPAAVQPGFIQADDGTPIEVFQNQSIDRRFDTDCHGVTFADGEYWVNNDQVNSILEGDSYQSSENPQVGDVAVYTDENGNVVHSASVVSVDAKTGEVTVEGLGGLETETHQDNVKEGWSDPNASVTYHRKINNENDQEKE